MAGELGPLPGIPVGYEKDTTESYKYQRYESNRNFFFLLGAFVLRIIQLQSDILNMSLFQSHMCVSRTDCLFSSVVRDISALVTPSVELAESFVMTRTAECMPPRSFSPSPLPLILTYSTILTILAYLAPRPHQLTPLSTRGI